MARLHSASSGSREPTRTDPSELASLNRSEGASEAEGNLKDHIYDAGARRGGGNGEHPSPHDPSRHAPAHRGETPRGPNAHDGRGDYVGRAHGDARKRGTSEGDPPARLRAETLVGSQRRHLLTHRPHDPPPAEEGTERNRGVCPDDD